MHIGAVSRRALSAHPCGTRTVLVSDARRTYPYAPCGNPAAEDADAAVARLRPRHTFRELTSAGLADPKKRRSPPAPAAAHAQRQVTPQDRAREPALDECAQVTAASTEPEKRDPDRARNYCEAQQLG